jgi:serine/threonine protein phosphatase PrpC
MDALKARGLVFAVMDGVGGAPLGMRAAQATADELRLLYLQPEFAPRPCESFPSAREVLGLLYRANQKVRAWGLIRDEATPPAGPGAEGRPQGAACVSAAYLSPAGNLTIFQAGDTAAFVYRSRSGQFQMYTGTEDIGGRSVRQYIGLGESLSIDNFPLGRLERGDLIALVTDGVYPKGFRSNDGIRDILAEVDGDPEIAAKRLVTRSRARGSIDDITALVIAFG